MFPTLSKADARARDATIDETIAHAARASFYVSAARAFAKARRSQSSMDALGALPLLDKPLAAREQERLIVPGVRAHDDAREAGIVSSATTREGRPLRVLRSPDEGGRRTGAPFDDGERAPHRVLEIYSPRHGVRMDGDPSRVLLPATLHPNTVDVVVDLLSARPRDRRARIQTIVAPLSTLKWITVALEERRVDASSFGVVEIGVTGYPLTAHARAWLSHAWGAPVFDNYSLSEIAGYAWECDRCAHLHYEGARVVAELVDPVSLARVPVKERAMGELVLTTCVPDVLRMPLIRYRTGDVVVVGPVCDVDGARGIVFRGRLAHSLVDGVGRGARAAYRILSRDLLEFGEATPDIAMHPHAIEVLGRVPPSDVGVPKIVVDQAARVVRAELRYDPARYPARAASVAVALRERVFLKGAAASGVRIELVRPGALDVAKMALKL